MSNKKPDEKDSPRRPAGELLVYQGQGMNAPLNVRLEGETVWLTQNQIGELFQTTQQNVSLHIQNVYEEGELTQIATHKDFLLVRREGARNVQRSVAHYNLDVIISVGYRVKSRIATQFRVWATERLREYLIKGFTMDDERLKGNASVVDHFDELLDRIRNIRASEARVYLMIRKIFALAVDYDSDEAYTRRFFAFMQNKMHYAATGLTAAEIVAERAI